MTGCLAALTPFGTVLYNPIRQRPLEANISTRFLRLYPFVLQDFFPFRLKFPVERRVLQQLIGREGLFRFVRHNRALKFVLRFWIQTFLKVLDNLNLVFFCNRNNLAQSSPFSRSIQAHVSPTPPPGERREPEEFPVLKQRRESRGHRLL